MPLAHAAWKPRPRVELLATRSVSIEDATQKIGTFVEKELAEFQANVSDNSLIKIKQLPEAHDKLRSDCGQHLDGHDGRPADCFVEVFARLEVHLSPYFLGAKFKHGLRRAVMELLLEHNQTLRCVPMTFSKLKPIGKQAVLVHESPYVHFLVQFYSIGFAPKPEQWLIGRTGSIQTPKGISVTIMSLFNGFVAAEGVPRGFRYNAEQKTWVDKEGRPLRKDSLVWFAVEGVHNSTGFLTLEGALRDQPQIVAGDGEAQPRQKKRRTGEEAVAVKLEVDSAATLPVAKVKKEKKTKKIKEEMG